MLLGRCCHCGDMERPRYVNLKCFDKTDGSIVWEFGPCFGPVQQYAADYLHAFQAVTPMTFDTYVYQSPVNGDTLTFANRNSVTLSANAVAAIDVVRLNHDDGTEANRNNVPYMFSFAEQSESIGFPQLGNLGFGNNDGLSGGGVVIEGNIPPQIELTDFASNNTTKTYIFHPHTMRAGSITFKTRVSDQTISFVYNAAASAVETAIESVGDVTSATVTGGPWPFAALNVSVTWSSSSGDFKSVNFQPTYVAGLSDRSTSAALYVIDPTTGNISSAVGYVFGDLSSAVKLHASVSGLVPTGTDAVARAYFPVAGASNSVCLSQSPTTSNTWWEGWDASAWSELWTIYNNHTISSGESPAYVRTRRSQNGNVLIVGSRKTLSAANYIGAQVSILAGTRTDMDHTNSPLNNRNASVIEQDGTAGTYGYHNFYTQVTQPESFGQPFNAEFDGRETDANGTLLKVGMGRLYGMDSADFYGLNLTTTDAITIQAKYPLQTPSMIASTNARGYLWRWYAPLQKHFTTGTEFRFKFTGNASNPTTYSNWIDWEATDATIETELNSVFPANTGGVVDNVQVFPFGAPSALTNTTGYLERYLEVLFAGAANATGVTEQYIPVTYVQRGKITVETRTLTPEHTPPGIASWDRATGALNWSRAFGTIGATTVAAPLDAWLRGSYVYAFGALVDNELP